MAGAGASLQPAAGLCVWLQMTARPGYRLMLDYQWVVRCVWAGQLVL